MIGQSANSSCDGIFSFSRLFCFHFKHRVVKRNCDKICSSAQHEQNTSERFKELNYCYRLARYLCKLLSNKRASLLRVFLFDYEQKVLYHFKTTSPEFFMNKHTVQSYLIKNENSVSHLFKLTMRSGLLLYSGFLCSLVWQENKMIYNKCTVFIHPPIHQFILTYIYMHAYTCTYIYKHTYIYIHAYIHTYTPTYVTTYVLVTLHSMFYIM